MYTYKGISAYGIHLEANAVQVYDVPARRHGELLFNIYVGLLPTHPASGADLDFHNDFCIHIALGISNSATSSSIKLETGKHLTLLQLSTK